MSSARDRNIYKTLLLETDAVLDAIERRFGFVVDKIVRLQGSVDLTYHVVQGGPIRNEYIFKVFADHYTSNLEQIKAEISLMKYLAASGITVPAPVKAKDKETFCQIDISCGQPFYTRMQTYIKGSLLRDNVITPELCKKYGRWAGKVDSVLEKFHCPFYSKTAEPAFLINYSENERLSVLLPYIKNERSSKLIAAGLQLFEQKIEPNFNSLPIQQIHGDLDCVNVIVTTLVESDGLPALGAIDFGDSRKTCRVYEPAIAVAGILAFAKQDPVVCAKKYLDSYQSVVKLTDLELGLLRASVICRFATIIALHDFNTVSDPNYDGYMLKACGTNVYDLMERLLAEEQGGSLAFLES